MKAKVRFLNIILTLSITLISQYQVTLATEHCDHKPVQEIITKDTSWAVANSPYTLSGPVQVDKNVTLTIEPGVSVVGNGCQLQLWGNLYAVGSPDNKIFLSDVSIRTRDDLHTGLKSHIELQHILYNGDFSSSVSVGSLDSINLRDSWLINVDLSFVYIHPIYTESYVERNIFTNYYSTADVYVYFREGTLYFRDNTSSFDHF
jgi:hypothetical protein